MKTIINILLIFILAVLSFAESKACFCTIPYAKHFCRAVDDSHIIVRATLIDSSEVFPSTRYYLRAIKIIDHLNLQIPTDTTVLLGQDGWNCGETLDKFTKGDTLILALVYWHSMGAYYLEGSCGQHYLRYAQGKVFEDIDFAYDTLDYDVFVDQLNDCMSLSTSTNELQSELALTTFPNPVQDLLNVETTASQGIYQVELFSLSGQTVRFQKGNGSSSLQLYTRALENGVYYLRVWVKGKMRMKKVMVMR